jgi:phage terminase small subunit
MALTEKQKRFCDEYLIDLNGTQAAIRAGYSERSARQISDRNMSNDDIIAYLNEKRKVLQDKVDLSQEWVLRRLKEISDRCMQAEPVMTFDGDQWVESGEYKFDSTGANKSTELIGKHLGMFVNKVDLSTLGESLNEKRPTIKLPGGIIVEI